MKTRMAYPLIAGVLLAGCLNRVAWMPDGRRVVFVQERTCWLVDLEGRRVKLADVGELGNAEVSAAPAGNWIAVAGRSGAVSRVVVLDSAGKTAWTGTVSGDDGRFMPGAWSADGSRLLLAAGKSSLVVEPATGLTRPLECAEAARFSAGDEVVSIVPGKDEATLERTTAAGVRKTARWALPEGAGEAEPLLITADARAVWWRCSIGGHDAVALSGADGRILFSSTRTLTCAGPDSRSYVTQDGGYAIVRAGGAALNLNAAYNAVLKADLSWQLADPATAAEVYDPKDLLQSAPAFSPDGKRAAILTPHLLCVIDLATNEVVPIAKW